MRRLFTGIALILLLGIAGCTRSHYGIEVEQAANRGLIGTEKSMLISRYGLPEFAVSAGQGRPEYWIYRFERSRYTFFVGSSASGTVILQIAQGGVTDSQVIEGARGSELATRGWKYVHALFSK